MQLIELTRYLDGLLQPWNFKDYAPNGLQVEGRADVHRIVCGVTASQALIDEAIARQADAILVHHGYFWKGEDSRIVGYKRQRLKALLANDISLLGYHLPLDAHLELGNNARLAPLLGVMVEGQTGEQSLLWHGRLIEPQWAASWRARLSQNLGREALLLGPEDKLIERVAWCSGGAQSLFAAAIDLGVDAFVTGEVSEQNQHMAWETGCVFIAAGHHATERYGIAALASCLQQDLALDVMLVDIDNPV